MLIHAFALYKMYEGFTAVNKYEELVEQFPEENNLIFGESATTPQVAE